MLENNAQTSEHKDLNFLHFITGDPELLQTSLQTDQPHFYRKQSLWFKLPKIQNTPRRLQFVFRCMIHQHLHMYRHNHQHAFTPVLHQTSSCPPAPVGPQDSKLNTHFPRGTSRPLFAPVPASHKATQKSFKSAKQGRWCALHVCIAWKIYYHEQLKRMQQKPTSICQELTPEYPAASPTDSKEDKEPERPSSRHLNLDSPSGHLGKTAENIHHDNRGHPSDSCTSSPHHSCTTKREKLDRPQNLHWKKRPAEREKHWGQQTDTAKISPLRDDSWNRDTTPGLDRHDGSCDRKRPFESDSIITAKRMKLEIADDQFYSSKTLHSEPSRTSLYTTGRVQHLCDLSVLHPTVPRTQGGLISYPGAEMHPYQTASWEPVWDIHKRLDLSSRQNVHKVFSVNSCSEIRIPLLVQQQKQAFHGFFAQPLNPPLALRQQEMVYHRGREFLHTHPETGHLHCCRHQLSHPGLLTSYLGP